MRILVLYILLSLSWLVLTSPRKPKGRPRPRPRPRPKPGMTAESEVSDLDISPVKGCPSEIPITKHGMIVAGMIYNSYGRYLPELSCTGSSYVWYAETKYTEPVSSYLRSGSVIINPGCTFIVFGDWNYAGIYKKFIGPQTIPKFPMGAPIYDCGIRCVRSFLWTCKQTYPSCQPADKWQYVTELDNSAQSLTAQFTYENIVGTEWSQSMTESLSVSATVSAEISASFWGNTAKLGVSATTGYDWTSTDSSTKSEIKSYTVEVTVPPNTKIIIMEVLGYCGDSKIHTQMFRVLDTNNVTLRTYHGTMTSYDLTSDL